MAENKNLKTLTLPNAQGELVKYDLAPKWENIEGKPESFPFDLTQASGILPIKKGGTGNANGYIRTGAKADSTIGNRATAEGVNTTASGDYSHAEGDGAKAIGLNSHAEGKGAEAHGADSHAEGRYAKAYGEGSHAEGNNTEAHELFSHAEGYRTRARGVYSHAEGDCAEANGRQSHAEGASTKALGSASHAEGSKTEAHQYGSHAEGGYSKATGGAAHAEGGHYKAFQEDGTYTEMGGGGTLASGNSSHAEGASTIASGNFSHASGYGTKASGEASYAAGVGQQEWSGTCTGDGTTTLTYASGPSKTLNVGDTLVFKHTGDALKSRERKIVSKLSSTKYELDDDLDSGVTYNVYRLVYNEASGKGARTVGEGTTASGNFSIAEGYKTIAQGNYSHAEGLHSKATVEGAHAEGYQTEATGKYAHSEGRTAKAQGYCSHAEGFGTTVSKDYGHAEGNTTKADGRSAHAEGEQTTASGQYSHAEGYATTASKDYSHAEGHATTASGSASHAEGKETIASGINSHAEGEQTTASGDYSHAEGYYTIASADAQHVQGRYNIEDTAKTYAHIVGNGNSTNRSNAHAIDWDGNANFAGDVYVGNANENKAGNKLATESFVTNKIAEAQLNSGGDVDLSGYATKDDLNSRVPTSRTVNGKALSSNVTLSANDVGARASTWNPSFLTDAGNSSYRGGLQYSGSPTNPTYMAVWDTDTSASSTQPNIRVRSINAEGARTLMGAAPSGYGLGTTTAKAPNDDPNQITKTGFYSAQHANLAPGSSGRSHILHIECTSDYAIQFQYDLDSSLQAVRRKIAGVWQDWELDNSYTLPAATSSTLGGVKVGSNITNSSGTISLTKANVTAALGYTPATAYSAIKPVVNFTGAMTFDQESGETFIRVAHNYTRIFVVNIVKGSTNNTDMQSVVFALHTDDYAKTFTYNLKVIDGNSNKTIELSHVNGSSDVQFTLLNTSASTFTITRILGYA